MVRLYTPDDLNKITSGDKWLATCLANKQTFNMDEVEAINASHEINPIKTYVAEWGPDETVEIFATDDESLRQFIAAEYNTAPIEISEISIITTYRTVEI
jgi:hypothetical protein